MFECLQSDQKLDSDKGLGIRVQIIVDTYYILIPRLRQEPKPNGADSEVHMWLVYNIDIHTTIVKLEHNIGKSIMYT